MTEPGTSRFVGTDMRVERPVETWTGERVRGVTLPPRRTDASRYHPRMVRGLLSMRGSICFIEGREVDRSTVRLADERQRSLVPATQAVHDGAEQIAAAVAAVLEGEDGAAREILGSIDPEPFSERWRRACAEYDLRHDQGLHAIYDEPRAKDHVPAAIQRAIQARDGWRCRYCAIRVVEPRVIRALTSRFPDELPALSNGEGVHWGLRYVAEHVIPRAHGGQNNEDNLVVACWPCNGAKADCSLAELFLEDPLAFEPRRADGWDGLAPVASTLERRMTWS